MMINETSFFRDHTPFELLRNSSVLPTHDRAEANR